ncbi:MAG: peptidoglycan editing factor PgeF [Desulfatiglandaceae bacterium]
MHGQGLNRFVPGSPGRFDFNSLSSFPGLVHGVFPRFGGVSLPPYKSLNVSYSVGDFPAAVSQNLSLIRETLGAERLFFMNQVHGNEIYTVKQIADGCKSGPPEADAVITSVPGIAIIAKLADCQGIVLYDPEQSVTAVVHSGWRGQVSNITACVVERMTKEFGSRPEALHAAISPSLGPCCAEFVSYRKIFPVYFRRFMVRENYFDLWEISRFQLQEAGVAANNISVGGLCTKCRTDLFFSYRAEGVTGRFCIAAMLQ